MTIQEIKRSKQLLHRTAHRIITIETTLTEIAALVQEHLEFLTEEIQKLKGEE